MLTVILIFLLDGDHVLWYMYLVTDAGWWGMTLRFLPHAIVLPVSALQWNYSTLQLLPPTSLVDISVQYK
jgi:hypothetical protein